MPEEDLADIVLRKWSAQLDILEQGRLIVGRHDLDPVLLEDLHQAYVDQDFDGFLEALVVLCRTGW